jgi:hypothetical protein
MAIAERTSETTWQGTLAGGTGTIRPASPVSRMFAGAKISVTAALGPAE